MSIQSAKKLQFVTYEGDNQLQVFLNNNFRARCRLTNGLIMNGTNKPRSTSGIFTSNKGVSWTGKKEKFISIFWKKLKVFILKPIFKRIPEKKRDTNRSPPPKTSLIERKIQQLKAQDRTFVLRKSNSPQGDKPSTHSYTENLTSNAHGILRYTSKGECKNFNLLARNKTNNRKIECRHLAYAFATGEFGTKSTGKYSSIDSIDKISNHQGIKIDAELLHTPVLFKQAQEGYYFDRESFGQTLHAAIKKQVDDNCQSKSYLFDSMTHSMALTMTWSKDESAIKVTFYDPNDSLRVLNFIVPSMNSLKDLKIEDLINPIALSCCFQEPHFVGTLLSTDFQHTPGVAVVDIKTTMNPTAIYHLLKNGHFSDSNVIKLIDETLTTLNQKEQENLLAARNTEGIPGLFMALQHGHSECAKACIELILASDFSEETKKELLAAKIDKDDEPSLSTALEEGHVACAKAYSELVRNSDLSDETKKYLLVDIKE